MAKFLSEVATGKRSVPQPNNGQVIAVPIPFVLPATAPAVNDIVGLCELPPGVELVDYSIFAPQLDSNGARRTPTRSATRTPAAPTWPSSTKPA